MKKQLFVGMAMAGLFASSGIITIPQTLDEAKTMGQQILMALPRAMISAWKEQAMPILNTMLGIGKDLWARYIWPIIGPEVTKRKAVIPGELEKEKEELSQELRIDLKSQGGFKGLWERFKVLIP